MKQNKTPLSSLQKFYSSLKKMDNTYYLYWFENNFYLNDKEFKNLKDALYEYYFHTNDISKLYLYENKKDKLLISKKYLNIENNYTTIQEIKRDVLKYQPQQKVDNDFNDYDFMYFMWMAIVLTWSMVVFVINFAI